MLFFHCRFCFSWGQPVTTPCSENEVLSGGKQQVPPLPGDPLREIVVDARSGQVVSDERHEAESLILRIHSGEILGEPGVVLGVLWGLALVVLLVSGGWVYLDMYRRRLKGSGKRGLFW